MKIIRALEMVGFLREGVTDCVGLWELMGSVEKVYPDVTGQLRVDMMTELARDLLVGGYMKAGEVITDEDGYLEVDSLGRSVDETVGMIRKQVESSSQDSFGQGFHLQTTERGRKLLESYGYCLEL